MAEQWCVLGSCWSCYRNSEGLFGLDNLWSTLVIYYKCVTHARGRPCVLTSALWWHFGFAHFISEPPQVFIQFCTNIFVYFTAYMIQELCKTPDRWPKVFSKMSCCSLAPCKDNKVLSKTAAQWKQICCLSAEKTLINALQVQLWWQECERYNSTTAAV